MPHRRASISFILAASTALLSACGAGSAAPPAPLSPASEPVAAEESASEPATLEAAHAQFDRAKAELDSASGASGRAAQAPQAAPPPAPSPPPPPRDASGAPSESKAYRTDAAPDACATSCRALASMRRAVQAICRLAGDRDAQCTDARHTLATSEQRIVACHCAAP